MKWIILVLFYFLYWGMCVLGTGTDKKNLIGLRSYPETVQSLVRKRLSSEAPKEKSIASILLSNLVFFTLLFSILGFVFKKSLAFDSYLSAFWYFLLFGEGLGVFDLLIIDLLWWRNTKRIRFSFLPEKAPYQNPSKHIDSFLRGIPLFVAVAALSAGIVTLI